MTENKTKPTGQSVDAFIDALPDPQQRQDSRAIVKLMQQVTRARPEMGGSSIIGFGRYHYRYASGREGDWMLVGLAPRKQNITLYIMGGFDGHAALLKRLGTFKTGKACLYIKKLADVDTTILKELVKKSAEHVKGTSLAP
jgi:hypothetical protein